MSLLKFGIYFAILLLIVIIYYYFATRYRARVVLYHSVSDDLDSKKTNISVSKFEQQIEYLINENYEFFKMQDMFKTSKMKAKKIFITFDDSLEVLYTNVFPIIKKYNVPITIYTCKKIDGKNLLTKEQILEMFNSGLVEFGAHSATHVNLKMVSDSVAKNEIIESKRYVESITKTQCTTFAYPYGKYYEKHVILISALNFDSAVVIDHKLYNYDITLRYQIPRIEPRGNMNLLQFKILLFFGKYKF